MNNQIFNHPTAAVDSLALPRGRSLSLARPLVMGILNVTPDSFSDGGRATLSQWNNRVLQMIKSGADIIDIGGESTRPGADPVSLETERERVVPVIKEIRKSSDIPISIDTYKSETAEAALDAGADIINDISAARFSSDMVNLVAGRKVPMVLMHMSGRPRDMQENPCYKNCVEEIFTFLKERIEFCVGRGIDRSQLIIDPGIGFGKRLEDNLVILANLNRFKSLGLPLLVGASRKSFINMIHSSGRPAVDRVGGSIAAALAAVATGADIIRVHDVDQTVEAIKVTEALRNRS